MLNPDEASLLPGRFRFQSPDPVAEEGEVVTGETRHRPQASSHRGGTYAGTRAIVTRATKATMASTTTATRFPATRVKP